jgi:hypothetical protein
MTSETTGHREVVSPPMSWGLLVLMVANVVVGIWKPGSAIATVLSYAFIGASTIWFGLKIRSGYRRRRPYWTRDSWLRYLRLAAMPVAAVIVVLFVSADPANRGFGGPQSTARIVSAGIFVALLLFGALGLGTAVDWMLCGTPSQQFTRTRWFQRRRPSAT